MDIVLNTSTPVRGAHSRLLCASRERHPAGKANDMEVPSSFQHPRFQHKPSVASWLIPLTSGVGGKTPWRLSQHDRVEASLASELGQPEVSHLPPAHLGWKMSGGPFEVQLIDPAMWTWTGHWKWPETTSGKGPNKEGERLKYEWTYIGDVTDGQYYYRQQVLCEDMASLVDSFWSERNSRKWIKPDWPVHQVPKISNIAQSMMQAISPECRVCHQKMMWTNYAEGDYAEGWECNNYSRCRNSDESCGQFRWLCRHCSNDLCQDCVPREAISVRYLPKEINGSVVLERVDSAKWRAAMPDVAAGTIGLDYRSEKCLDAKTGGCLAWWKSVEGFDEDDGWVRVYIAEVATNITSSPDQLEKQLETIEDEYDDTGDEPPVIVSQAASARCQGRVRVMPWSMMPPCERGTPRSFVARSPESFILKGEEHDSKCCCSWV
jgi:hypothetical protein